MELLYCFVVVVLATVSAVSALDAKVVNFHVDTNADHAQHTNFQPRDDPNRGYVQDCAHPGTFFNISWTPKDITPTSQVRFDVDIISPIFFDKGKVKGLLLYEGTPMLTFNKDVTCDEVSAWVSQLIPSQAPLFSCPLKKGQRIVDTVIFSQTEELIGYDGQFEIKGQLYDTEGTQLLCIQIDVIVLPH